ncbi:methylase [Sphingomonas sp. ID1715]|uniref:strawberry notch-like NTP hydrolase domain-containing protein n=1 Tax=Sphingomonas sp. ID1715 TaxID=1656898 RepID=UPI0014888265|nr:strawberry notch family protein [Sphingomonas sp. ID1715]NNM77993.1 methylase [Sphingomonas sp. ID1715]
MATRTITTAHSHPPHVRTALALAPFIEAQEPITRRLLRQLFESATGTSAASGGWCMRHAYDALELALALYASNPSSGLFDGEHAEIIDRLERLTAALPLQSHRSEDQIALQQFSTPLVLSYAAARAARVNSADTVLEPSAGNGLLVACAARSRCSLVLNEIDDRRFDGLQAIFTAARVSGHDAELIDDLLDPAIRPTLVLMNPPFARSIGRGTDGFAAARHLVAAYRRLQHDGRLVAILPAGFNIADWAKRSRESVTVRLDALLPPGMFGRHGTGVATRMIVLDKLGGCERTAQPGSVERVGQLLALIADLPARGPTFGQTVVPIPPTRAKLSLFGRAAVERPLLQARQPVSSKANAAEPLCVEALDEPAPPGDPVGIYLPWRPSRLRINGAQAHPTDLVESLAMGSIAAPKVAYRPILGAQLVSKGVLSKAQLETLVYAGAAFERNLPGAFLPDGEGCALKPDEHGQRYRCGFFLGDGTGAGKGRQIAGVILDQWLRGNRRHIWISKNETLLEDARRDWTALGGLALDIQPLSAWKLDAPVLLDQGILFVTYPTLRSGKEEKTRLAQIIAWAGVDFEGVIAFDEAHAMANALGCEGSRGRVKGSEQGITGLRLQNLLPRARVLYASATGASDIANLSYASRLGLWGQETAFADREAFIAGIRAGGIAAMELVARDLKALGLYTARALSFAGVEYELLEHALTPDQIGTYDAYADAWSIIHQNLEAALEATRVVDAENGRTLNANAKGAALSRFEGTKQRFFAQLLLSMKLPSLLPAIENDLEHGHAVVVQLVSTAEAMLDRRLADLDPIERELLEIDLSPREYLVDYLLNAFPTRQMRVFTDDEGNTRSEPMTDADGHPVHCRAALAARDALVEQLCALPPIGTALDMLTERFGTEMVAEVTGRTRRLVTKDGAQSLERRSGRSNLAEANAFMDGTKRLLVFSDAGGTGRSYHACLKAKNQARRIHYLLEPGWRADAAIQGLGRTHRSAQASAPLFRPVTTDVRGERRFISTIARRLDALGALTRGQRQTGGQNLFDPADNLESEYAKNALLRWYGLLFDGKLQSTSFDEFQRRTGLRLETEDGALREDLPPIQRWLNRILALPIALQNAIFDEFMGLVEARVTAAREAGTLDLGLETLPVDSVEIKEDRVIRTDQISGATTHLLKLELSRRGRPTALEQVLRLADRPDAVPVRNHRSGKVALRVNARSLLSEDGASIGRYELIRPARREYLGRDQFGESSWEPISIEAFNAAWEAEADEISATVHAETLYIATGLLLPIWNKLPDDHCQVLRVVDEHGASVLGRAVPISAMAEFSRKLGLDITVTIAPDELIRLVERSNKPQPIAGTDMSLKRALVGGTQRLELVGWEPRRLPEYKAHGCFTDIIRYQTRLFVPVDRATEIVRRLEPPSAPA